MATLTISPISSRAMDHCFGAIGNKIFLGVAQCHVVMETIFNLRGVTLAILYSE